MVGFLPLLETLHRYYLLPVPNCLYVDQGVVSLILVMPQFREAYPQVDPSHPGYGFNTVRTLDP